MSRWNKKTKLKQTQIINQQQPWRKSTGPKTKAGKERSKMNARKHGGYDASAKAALQYIKECGNILDYEEKLLSLKQYVEDCLVGGPKSPNNAFYPEGVLLGIAEINRLQNPILPD